MWSPSSLSGSIVGIRNLMPGTLVKRTTVESIYLSCHMRAIMTPQLLRCIPPLPR